MQPIRTILTSLLLILSANQGHAGLLAYYKFDRNAEDSSGKENHGTIHGGAGFTEGFDGSDFGAILLDGIDDYVELPALGISDRQDWTVTFWVRGAAGQKDRRVFAEGANGQIDLFTIGTDYTGANGSVDLYVRSRNDVEVVRHNQSLGQPFDGTWHEVAVVCHEGRPRFYIDGQPEGEFPKYDGSDVMTNTTAVGAMVRSSQAKFHFAGEVDELRVYDHAINVVTSGADDGGPGTLRKLLGDGSIDLPILFDSSVRVVNLNSEIALTGGIRIIDGQSRVTIEASGRERIFALSSLSSLTLRALTLSGGRGVNGGAISNSGRVFAELCTFRGNRVTGNGGAIYNEPGARLRLSNCAFHRNHANENGGAIANDSASNSGGIAEAYDCSFGENSAWELGGAIWNSAEGNTVSEFDLERCTLVGNRTDVDGGAIYNTGRFMLKECLLLVNSAEDDSGAIHNRNADATLQLDDCALLNNFARDNGGGVLNFADATAVINNCTFDTNVAGGDGGALFNSSTGIMSLNHCTVTRNYADGTGGAGRNGSGSTLNINRSIVSTNNSPAITGISGEFETENEDSNFLNGDPGLALPGFYGGVVPSRPPTSGSPVIDRIAGSSLDGRSLPRFGKADLGAAELQPFGEVSFNQEEGEFKVRYPSAPGVTYVFEGGTDLKNFYQLTERRSGGLGVEEAFRPDFWPERLFTRVRRLPSSLEGLRLYVDFENSRFGGSPSLGDSSLVPTALYLTGTPEFDRIPTGQAETRTGIVANLDGDGESFKYDFLNNQPSGSFTVSAWFRAKDIPNGAERAAIFESWPTFSASLGLREGSNPADTRIQFFLQTSGPSVSIEYDLPDGGVLDRWIHGVQTYDAETGIMRVYLDGKEVGNATTGESVPDWKILNFGTYRGGNEDRWFNGQMDDVGFWRRALTPAEVAYLFYFDLGQGL